MGREILKPEKVLREDLEIRKQAFENQGWFFTHYEANDSWSALEPNFPDTDGQLIEAQKLGELLDKIDEHVSGIQIVEVSEPKGEAIPEPAETENSETEVIYGGEVKADEADEPETEAHPPAEIKEAEHTGDAEEVDGGAVEASGDDEEIVYEDKLPTTTIESCKIVLSNDEILQRNQDFLKRMTDKDDEVARFASLKDTHKANLKFIELDVERLRQILNSGQEWRDIECSLEYDFYKGEVTIRRQDTYEVVKKRVMTRDELQKHLFATRGKRKFSGHQEF